MIRFAALQSIEQNWLDWVNWPQYLAMLLSCAALWLALVKARQRIARNQQLRKSLVFLLNGVAFVALLGFILQPEYRSDEKPTIRLITLDANADASDENRIIVQSEYPSYRLADDKLALSETVSQLKDTIDYPQQILLRHSQHSLIEVLGDGLWGSQWRNFGNVEINYQIPQLANGLIDIGWNQRLNLGEALIFSGRWQAQSTNQKTDLRSELFSARLKEPGGKIVAQSNLLADEYFSLSAFPKVAGRHTYSIEVIDGQKNIVAIEPIRVDVGDRAKAKILAFTSAPSFEIKQLQNWAAKNGAQLLVRSTISRGKMITRETNLFDADLLKILKANEQQNNQHIPLSAAILSQFDLLIIDGRGLLALTAQQIAGLTQSVENGLGIFVLVDQSLIDSAGRWPAILNGIELTQLTQTRQVSPRWRDANAALTSPIEQSIPAVAASFRARASQPIGLRAIVESAQAEPLVVQTDLGKGKISVSLIKQTHQWVTNGNQLAHSQYWQNIIASVARERQINNFYIGNLEQNSLPLSDPETLVFEGQNYRVCHAALASNNYLLVDSEANIQRHYEQSQPAQKILLQPVIQNNQQALAATIKCGVFWAKSSGWYRIEVEDNKKTAQQADQSNAGPQTPSVGHWFFVESTESWSALQQRAKISATLTKQLAYRTDLSNKAHNNRWYQPLNLSLFWWMFLISASLIWLERKID